MIGAVTKIKHIKGTERVGGGEGRLLLVVFSPVHGALVVMGNRGLRTGNWVGGGSISPIANSLLKGS